MIRTIFFDLDGTLLPMDQDRFLDSYFRRIMKSLAPRGYDPKELLQNIWAGTSMALKNDGSRTNERAFWDYFSSVYGEKAALDKPAFDAFYRGEFQKVAEDCGYDPESKRTIDRLKADGYQLVLATNPVFPAVATESRVRWAGLEPADFIHRTTYENSSYCKPNPAYYQEILDKLHLRAEECLMVGNDAEEDGAAEKTGMRVFFLTNCFINKKELDISGYPRGGFRELLEFIQTENQ